MLAQQVFHDPDTGTLFGMQNGRLPERDRNGELAFRAISYTPWPITEQELEGERLRIPVGPVNQRELRTFVFPRYPPRLSSGCPSKDH